MYQFVDRSLATLDQGNRFLVWSMRNWVAASAGQRCPGAMLAKPFAALNLLPALQPFIRTMGLLNCHGLQQMKFCHAACPAVAEHEAVMLSLACLLAHGRAAEGQKAIAALVAEEATGEMFDAITGLTSAMAAGGFTLRWPANAPLAR